MSEIHVLARLTLRPGVTKDKILPVLKELVESTKSEPGTLQYDVNFQGDSTVVFYEVYKDNEAVKIHSKNLKMVPPFPSKRVLPLSSHQPSFFLLSSFFFNSSVASWLLSSLGPLRSHPWTLSPESPVFELLFCSLVSCCRLKCTIDYFQGFFFEETDSQGIWGERGRGGGRGEEGGEDGLQAVVGVEVL